MLSGTMPEPVTAAHKNSRGFRIESIEVPAVFVQVFHYMIFQSEYCFSITLFPNSTAASFASAAGPIF